MFVCTVSQSVCVYVLEFRVSLGNIYCSASVDGFIHYLYVGESSGTWAEVFKQCCSRMEGSGVCQSVCVCVWVCVVWWGDSQEKHPSTAFCLVNKSYIWHAHFTIFHQLMRVRACDCQYGDGRPVTLQTGSCVKFSSNNSVPLGFILTYAHDGLLVWSILLPSYLCMFNKCLQYLQIKQHLHIQTNREYVWKWM